MKLSGIYKIINLIDLKYYVGSSKNINEGSSSRWNRHTKTLNKNCHHNVFLQRAWNKYGQKYFIFIFVENVEPITKSLLSVEQSYLDIAKMEPDRCYNLNFKARGGLSECVREKMSRDRRGSGSHMFGKKHSKDTIQKMKEAQTGEKHAMFGKHPTKESRDKMKESKMDEKNNFYGKTHNQKSIDKMRKSLSKLSNEDVLHIKNYPKFRGSGVELSIKFNMSTSNVSNIRNNKRWHDLTAP